MWNFKFWLSAFWRCCRFIIFTLVVRSWLVGTSVSTWTTRKWSSASQTTTRVRKWRRVSSIPAVTSSRLRSKSSTEGQCPSRNLPPRRSRWIDRANFRWTRGEKSFPIAMANYRPRNHIHSHSAPYRTWGKLATHATPPSDNRHRNRTNDESQKRLFPSEDQSRRIRLSNCVLVALNLDPFQAFATKKFLQKFIAATSNSRSIKSS